MDYLKRLLDQNSVRGSVAEIGYFRGEGSTPILLEHVCTHGGNFYSMDLFDDTEIWNKALAQFSGHPAEALQGYSVEVGENWGRERLDFLFIDGDHGFPRVSRSGRQSGVALDILTWHPLLNVGGVLAFHDYTGTDERFGAPSLMAVEHAVDAYCIPPHYEYIGSSGTIRAFRKLRDGTLYPRFKAKKAPEGCRRAWNKLAIRGLSDQVLIWGKGESANGVRDAVLALNPAAQIAFTDSYTTEPGTTSEGDTLLPCSEAKGFGGDIIIGSIFEEPIGKALAELGLAHVADYYGYFEFLGWAHAGRLQREH